MGIYRVTLWNLSAKEGHVHVRRCGRASHFVAAVIFTLTEKDLPDMHDYSKPSIFQ